MRDFRDAKTMAKGLRRGLGVHGLTLTHSQSLELIAQAFGYDNWNILAARIEAAQIAPAALKPPGEAPMHCSFCRKSQHDVQLLIAGPDTFICNGCVELCDDIVEDNEVLRRLRADEAAAPGAGPPVLTAYLAERSAEQLAAYLARAEKTVAGQQDLVRALDGKGGELPPFLKEKSDAERARHRAKVSSELAVRQRSIELVSSLLAAREAPSGTIAVRRNPAGSLGD